MKARAPIFAMALNRILKPRPANAQTKRNVRSGLR